MEITVYEPYLKVHCNYDPTVAGTFNPSITVLGDVGGLKHGL